MTSLTRNDLLTYQPRTAWFVGIDSDGCVFDSMEVKQKQCFHGLIVSMWRLEPIEPLVRQAAEFVNLYSQSRGSNRFPALLKSIDLIRDLPAVRAAGVTLPAFDGLRRWIDEETELGNPALARRVRETGDEELRSVLAWSEAVNARVEEVVTELPPFPGARECIERMHAAADIVVVSQTPEEALIREWTRCGLTDHADLIAGQELGTKTEHIAMTAGNRYAPGHVLMIGDAPGDQRAAEANDACFYPINPGDEIRSWRRLHEEAFDRFLAGAFTGDYEDALKAEFNALLPDQPDGDLAR